MITAMPLMTDDAAIALPEKFGKGSALTLPHLGDHDTATFGPWAGPHAYSACQQLIAAAQLLWS